jgi:hypothetical protein
MGDRAHMGDRAKMCTLRCPGRPLELLWEDRRIEEIANAWRNHIGFYVQLLCFLSYIEYSLNLGVRLLRTDLLYKYICRGFNHCSEF